MEVGEQQEDAAVASAMGAAEQNHEEVTTAMESDHEQGGGEGEETTAEVETEEREDNIVGKEDAVMESLPVEVETDKLRREREKAPDNAEERAVHESAKGGLGFHGENASRVSDEEGSRQLVVGLGGAEERNGPAHEVHVEGEAEEHVEEDGDAVGTPHEVHAQEDEAEEHAEEDGDVEGEAIVVVEVEMLDAAAAVDERDGDAEELELAEEKPAAGVEKNGTHLFQTSMKKNASAALENVDSAVGEVVVKKPKKKANVWSKSTTRKTSRKSKPVKIPIGEKKEECVEVNPATRYALEEKNGIQLSKDQKAEKVELSLDKMQASSEKGYRMVRATRGITEGAWYFEVLVKDLGATGHTRLGWSTWKGDLQAPVGFDANSYAFRDVDGSKVHQAVREPYGAPYFEGDTIGFYISLPNGDQYAPQYNIFVTKAAGTRQVYPVPVEKEEKPPLRVPGSEVAFFKNGVCQGVAFTDIYAGEYFPAASMYTFPSPEKKCSVRFNFGPSFQFPVEDWAERPVPLPMSQAPPPEGLAAANVEEPPPADTPNKSDTPNIAGGKQRMAAERGNGTLEGRVAVGSSVRTKRATDDKDRIKRPGMPGKRLSIPKGTKKILTLPRTNHVAKSPMSDASLQIEVNLEGCSNDGSGDFEVGPSLQDQGNSSDTQTD